MFVAPLTQHEAGILLVRIKAILLLTFSYSLLLYPLSQEATALPCFRWLLLNTQSKLISVIILSLLGALYSQVLCSVRFRTSFEPCCALTVFFLATVKIVLTVFVVGSTIGVE